MARVPVRGAAETAALRVLSSDEPGGLFQPIHDPVLRGTMPAYAGAFFVKKSNGLNRIIVDARAGNSHMTSIGHAFSLFDLKTLIGVISNVSRSETWFAINQDLRHWFHQIPFRNQPLRRYFAVPVHNGPVYLPWTAPMGWLDAPAIGQNGTWSLLLAGNRDGTPSLSEHSGIVPGFLEGLTRPPTWVPLVDGGGIFVILDNILVVTRTRSIADYWKRRIETQMAEFRAVLKNPSEIITMSPSNGVTFDFLGIRWGHNWRRVVTDAAEELPVDRAGQWGGTYRQLASALGRLLWFHRVHDTKAFSVEMRELRSIYAYGAPVDGRWNSNVLLPPAALDILQRHWSLRASQRITVNQILPPPTAPRCAAVDASNVGIGVVVYSDGAGSADAHRTYPNTEASHFIGVAELRAIDLGVQWLVQRHPECTLLVIATDSLNAKGWVQKGCARNARANEILAELDTHLDGRRLYLVYVPTKDNVADEPSRNAKELVAARIKATGDCLKKASVEAGSVWLAAGLQVGGGEVVLAPVASGRPGSVADDS